MIDAFKILSGVARRRGAVGDTYRQTGGGELV